MINDVAVAFRKKGFVSRGSIFLLRTLLQSSCKCRMIVLKESISHGVLRIGFRQSDLWLSPCGSAVMSGTTDADRQRKTRWCRQQLMHRLSHLCRRRMISRVTVDKTVLWRTRAQRDVPTLKPWQARRDWRSSVWTHVYGHLVTPCRRPYILFSEDYKVMEPEILWRILYFLVFHYTSSFVCWWLMIPLL